MKNFISKEYLLRVETTPSWEYSDSFVRQQPQRESTLSGKTMEEKVKEDHIAVKVLGFGTENESEFGSVDKVQRIEDLIREKRPFYKAPHLLKLVFYVFALTMSATISGYDGSMLNGLQSLTIWNNFFGDPTGSRLGVIANGYNFGGLIAFPVSPFLSDKFGRKIAVVVGSSIIVLGAILQGVSTNFAFFLVARIVIGFGSGISGVSSPVLISEIAYPLHRSASTFSYNVCYYLGATIASWVTYGTRVLPNNHSWRIPSFLQGLMPLLQIAVVLFLVPESPRFLVSKGKVQEAEDVIFRLHTDGSKHEQDVQLVEFELNEIQNALEIEKKTKVSYTDFVKSGTNLRKRFFITFWMAAITQFSGNGLLSYYLSKVLDSIGITDEKQQLQINGCLMIYCLAICTVFCYTLKFFKRRTLFVGGMSSMLVCYIIWTVLSALNQQRNFEDKGLAKGVLAMIFLFTFAFNFALNGIPYLYLTEIMPYSYRAKGMNLFYGWVMVISIFNGFVNPIAMQAIEWKYYIVYCCVILVEVVVVYFVFPETSGFTLEEVGQVFGDEHVEPVLATSKTEA